MMLCTLLTKQLLCRRSSALQRMSRTPNLYGSWGSRGSLPRSRNCSVDAEGVVYWCKMPCGSCNGGGTCGATLQVPAFRTTTDAGSVTNRRRQGRATFWTMSTRAHEVGEPGILQLYSRFDLHPSSTRLLQLCFTGKSVGSASVLCFFRDLSTCTSLLCCQVMDSLSLASTVRELAAALHLQIDSATSLPAATLLAFDPKALAR